MAVSIDVLPLIAGALFEERRFWRETAACHIDELVRAIEGNGRMHRRPIVPKSALRRELIETAEALRAAIDGDLFSSCEACGHAVRPGDATIHDNECGEMHADCLASASQQPVRPGDKVYLDPESIVFDGDGPKPDHIVAGVASALFTDDQILARLTRGETLLGLAKNAESEDG